MSKASHYAHGAYKMTPNRRTALRKAQRAAAIKRHQRAKRNKRIAVGAGIGAGVLAGVGAGIVLGRKTSVGAPKSANPKNTGVRTMGIRHRESVMQAGAVSPPRDWSRFRLRRPKPVVPGPDTPTPTRRTVVPPISEEARKATMEAATTKSRPGRDDITGLPTKDYNPAFRAPRVRGGKVSANAAAKAVKKDQAAKVGMGVGHDHLRAPGTRVNDMINEGTARKPYRPRKRAAAKATPAKRTGSRGISAEQRLKNAAMDQWIKDFES